MNDVGYDLLPGIQPLCNATEMQSSVVFVEMIQKRPSPKTISSEIDLLSEPAKEDKRKRLGVEATQPHRIHYRQLTR